MTQERRVLSIQSYVAVGYVGNKAAVFPLQLLGFEVDAVNTVEFSNHTGYKRWGGSKMTVQHLQDVFDAFEKNGFIRHSHLLTGYIPGPEALQLVSDTVDRQRAANPDLIYLCDPVMGDEGKLYVAADCVPIYKRLIPKATVITPNDFEAEQLTDIKINSVDSLKRALATLHERYSLPHAVISSCRLPTDETERLSSGALTGACLVCAGSSMVKGSTSEPWAIVFPAYAEHFEGVGDVFSALVLAHFGCEQEKAPTSLARTVELAIASLAGVISRTRAAAMASVDGDTTLLQPHAGEEELDIRATRLRRLELRLVQSQSDILHPSVTHRAVLL